MKAVADLQKKPRDELLQIISSLTQTVDAQQEKLRQRESFIKTLEEMLALEKQRRFGRKSEKNVEGIYQGSLFDEAIMPENPVEVEQAEETITVPEHTRKKRGRKPLPKDLPRIQQIYDLPEADKICACGCELTRIGEEKTEQLDYIPAKVQVIEHIKLKYACKHCHDTIKTSPMPKQPIPKSIASPGLLAHVLVSKYKDHLPLYRQEAIFQRLGIDIARHTLSLWMIRCGECLLPLYKLLQHQITTYDIAYADETRVQVLKEPERPPDTQSYMWCFIGGPPDKRSVIYQYDPGRAHTVIESVLEDFQGYLHCDGYVAYDTYASDHEVKLTGCWMHARRRFVEITKTTKKEGLAHQAVATIAKLYRIEKAMKAQHLRAEQIKAYRLKHAKPILDQFKAWLEKHLNTTLPQSPIGKSIAYCLNHWHKLICYLEDGRLDIDNGLTERAIKLFVIGRNNWMFSNSVAGVEAGKIIYSIIQTCQYHQVEPYAYLRYVLTHLPNMQTEQEIEAILPFNIDRKILL